MLGMQNTEYMPEGSGCKQSQEIERSLYVVFKQ